MTFHQECWWCSVGSRCGPGSCLGLVWPSRSHLLRRPDGPELPDHARNRLEPVAAGFDGDPIAAMRAPLGRRRPAVDQDPGRVDAVAEHGVVDGEQITRRRLHLSRRRAWATVRQAGTGGKRPSTATGMAEPCSSPASAAATAAASSHSSSHARGVSRS
jgi:hypothetical protein